MTTKKRRYLMSFTSVVFMFIAGTNAQTIIDGSSSGVLTWVVVVAALVAGIAGILSVNQYANREVAAAARDAVSGEN